MNQHSASLIAKCFFVLFFTLLTSTYNVTNAKELKPLQKCILESIKDKKAPKTVEELVAFCESQTNQGDMDSNKESESPNRLGIISKRFLSEGKTEFDPFVITPHLMNYILPAVTTNGINKQAYSDIPEYQENFEDIEAKIQLSIKVPLNKNSLFILDDKLYFGFALQSWWQVYSSNNSKPFRETNYTPEVFYVAPMEWHQLGEIQVLV